MGVPYSREIEILTEQAGIVTGQFIKYAPLLAEQAGVAREQAVDFIRIFLGRADTVSGYASLGLKIFIAIQLLIVVLLAGILLLAAAIAAMLWTKKRDVLVLDRKALLQLAASIQAGERAEPGEKNTLPGPDARRIKG
ncbi:hypothetical protein K402DRAFT_408603 [Aulographum hederae CBS 113979]|uniref:Uncharacterized protein n=1 Tax=Aulographum hederae CBS 113979 TaxID=1176131 RepID=A0A6G1GKI6_9PEZI|nr:hypothetical protein K402DRAFT_408603 [Aulographum hederae CBS 113979]